MLLLLLLAVLLAGQDETPAPNNFQTILKSTGMRRHRPVFTAMDVSTRSFKINMPAFSSRLLDILIRVKRIQLSKLKVEYRPIAGHYVRAIQEKGSLLQKAVHNGIFFIMKKFWEQVHVPNPLPTMDLTSWYPRSQCRNTSSQDTPLM